MILAGYLVTATIALACGSKAAIAADMPLKVPETPAYQWGGCYLGANLGGGSSGTNFSSTVDPGTYLAAADAATVERKRRRWSKRRWYPGRWTGRM